jgi:hypothetical protein
MNEQRPWHRMFGLTWTDFFTGQPVTVEMEKDLSVKKQLLDVLLIRKEAEFLDCRLPDGFENLARFNLVTFKSHMEKLSLWTLQELVGHYVNLFSTRGELLVYGGQHYQVHSADTSTLMLQLFRRFRQEIQTMPTPLEEFAREAIDEILKELPAEKRLEGLSPEQRVQGLSPEQRVQGLSREELLKLAEKLKGNGTSAKP